MKKTIAIFLSAITLLSAILCGCSGSTSESSAAQSSGEAVAETRSALKLEEGKTYKVLSREIWCENDGKKIYGIAYYPDTEQKVPLVITCHGLGTNHEAGEAYAKKYAEKGVAGYCFDFCGGSKSTEENKSDGESTQMSVMTESADLEAVFNAALSWDFVDTSRIFFQGGSQGGLVSAITGIRLEDKISGLILLYPAFAMYDFVHYAYPSYDNISGNMEIINDMVIGEAFAKDLWDYDVREYISDFNKPVIIIQGTDDTTVPPSVAEDAASKYPNCELKMIEGAGHGFGGEELDEAAEYALEFLYKNC